jgi:hypothetical protein
MMIIATASIDFSLVFGVQKICALENNTEGNLRTRSSSLLEGITASCATARKGCGGKGSMAGEDGEGRLAWEEVKGLDVVAI